MSDRKSIDEIRERIVGDGVILCVRFGGMGGVVDACRAAARGGLRILEITLTTPGWSEVIEELSGDKDLSVGGGTVLTVEEVRAVANAGGQFALSPVFDPAVVDEALRLGLLPMPGAATPGEILAAHRHGAPLVKIFPAGALGGPDYIRAIRGPLPQVPLVPTSGPSSETIADYVAAGAVAVGVGREVFPPGFDLDGAEAAARRVRSAMDLAKGRV
ncbi:MAG: bifunctional 4-hydroxy-2-oxoglutarate aldolase/2-dehydro-3-deoxy-phosphogluconate aldolase [Candidatus Eisenbacteria bacterium]